MAGWCSGSVAAQQPLPAGPSPAGIGFWLQVMILDWDVHHGNGTQAIFWEDPSVLLVDIHQADVWPGSGGLEETGAGGARPEGWGGQMQSGQQCRAGLSICSGQLTRKATPACRLVRCSKLKRASSLLAPWPDLELYAACQVLGRVRLSTCRCRGTAGMQRRSRPSSSSSRQQHGVSIPTCC